MCFEIYSCEFQTDYNSKLYRGVCALNLVSFVPCRFGAVFTIIYGMFVWGERVSPTYFKFLVVAISAMTFINFILYWRLVKSDLLRGIISKKSSRKELHANNNIKVSHQNGEGDSKTSHLDKQHVTITSIKAKTN